MTDTPWEKVKDAPIANLEFALAQLRHAYQQMTGPAAPLSPFAHRSFAEGLIAPQIRRLEAEVAALDACNTAEMSTPSSYLKTSLWI